MADNDQLVTTRPVDPPAASPGLGRTEVAVAPEDLPAGQGGPPQATEQGQQQEAREAREAAPRGRRQAQPAAPPSTETAPVKEGENYFSQFKNDPPDDGIGLMERMRLNRQDAFYKGSVAGSARLAAMAHIYATEDPPDISPEQKKAHQGIREEYQSIVADLQAYEDMTSFGSTAEALVSFGGQLEGTMISPESWVGWGAKGANWVYRATKSALQQGAIQGATDPVVQGLDIQAGVQEGYDPVRTAVAMGFGGAIGFGGHAAGEAAGAVAGKIGDMLWGPRFVRKQFVDLADMDVSFESLMTARDKMDPNIVGQRALEPPPEPARPAAAATSPIQEAVAGLPPAPEGTVRMYHGGEEATGGGARDVTPDPQYARDFGAGDKPVWYVDVPADSPWLREIDTTGTSAPRTLQNSVAPEEVMAGAKLVPGTEKAAAAPAAREPGPEHSFDDEVKAQRKIGEKADADARKGGEARPAKMAEERDYEARRAAFEKEVGPDIETLRGYGFDEEAINDVSKLYDRQPGEHPQDALERAVSKWEVEAVRQVMDIEGLDPALKAELEAFERGEQAASEMLAREPFRYQEGKLANLGEHGQGGLERELPGTTSSPERPGGVSLESTFEPQAGGRAAESGGREAPRTEEGAAGRGEGAGSGGGARGEGAATPQVEAGTAAGADRGRQHAELVASPEMRALREEAQELRLKSKRTAAENKRLEDVRRLIRQKLTIPEDVVIQIPEGNYTSMDHWTAVHKAALEEGFGKEGAMQLADRQNEKLFGTRAEQTAAANAERKAPATERTAQGEQTLIPGVEPITERERIAAEVNKPMRGGDEPAGGLFDTDTRAQGDIFSLRAADGRPDIEPLAERRGGGGLVNEQDRPDLGVEGPPSPAKQLAIRSLQQQARDLASALGFPLRQGRVESRGALGTFNRRSGVVRVKEIPDFEVVAHEGGHALEARVGPLLTELTEDYATELGRLDYDPTLRRVNEGFAEFIRLYIGEPEAATNLAPTFARAFRDLMQQQAPDLLAAIDRTAVAYRAYLDAPSVDAVGAVRRSHSEETETIGKQIKASVEAMRKREMPPVVKAFVQGAYDALLDKYAPFTRAVRELGTMIKDNEGALVDLKAVDDPSRMIRLLQRARQGAVDAMQRGVSPYHSITPEGPALADAIVKATGQTSEWGAWDPVRLRDFDTYLIARRAIDLWDRYKAGDLANPPVAFSQADARVALDELEKAFPQFREASDMVEGYAKELLRKEHESGNMSRESFDKILETPGFYVPFLRDRTDIPGGGGRGGGSEGGPGLVNLSHRIKGSSRDIYSPIESLMMRTFTLERTVRLNDIVNSFGRLAERAGPGGGEFIERLPAHEARQVIAPLQDMIERRAKEIGMDPAEAQTFIASMSDLSGESPLTGRFFKMERATGRGEPLVFSREGGELVAWRVKNEKEGMPLFDLLTEAPETVSDIFVQLIGTAAGLKRAGITTSPTFAIANYVRDQFATAILRPDYIPMISGLRGLWDEIRQGESARGYTAMGGVSGGAMTGPVERAMELDIDAMRKRGFLVHRLGALRDMMTDPSKFGEAMKGLLELASVTEAGTRNSIYGKVFEQKKALGLSDYEASAEAALQAQDILDFSRHGSRTLAITKMVPFLNATAQGLDKFRRTGFEPLFRNKVFQADSEEARNALLTLTKFGGVGAGLGAVWAAINADSEAYRDTPPSVKGTHVVVPVGNKLVLIPKPFELGLGFTLGEYAVERLKNDDPRAFSQFVESAWDVLKLNVTDIPIVTAGTELALGKSLFTGRDIVPGTLQGLPAPMQYNDRTSEMAKWIGKQTGMSPIKIEYAIGSQFGNWGRDVLALSQGVDEDSPAKNFDDRIFFRRFVKDPTRSSDVVSKFWGYMARTTGTFNQVDAAYDALIKARSPSSTAQAKELMNGLPDAQKAFVTLKSGGTEDGKPAFNADEKRLHPLQRAYNAVTVLNGLRQELSTNNYSTYGDHQVALKLDPRTRRDLLDDVRELSQMEMRNALVIMGEGGFANRPMLKPDDVMDRIRHIDPGVADEIASRYATAKVATTDAIQKAWPTLRDSLVRFGTQADLKPVLYDVLGQGTEFAGTKAKKPPKLRGPIAGSETRP